MRKGEATRETAETKIEVEVELDGSGNGEISTGIGFFDHMLAQIAKQGLFDIKVSANGDLACDDHHIVEDVGIALGEAFREALGNKKGIARYGFFMAPMDEALAQVVVDLSGRPWCEFDAEFRREKIGGLSTEMIEDFFRAFASACMANVQVRLLAGRNDHHKAEAIFKCFARALRSLRAFSTMENILSGR